MSLMYQNIVNHIWKLMVFTKLNIYASNKENDWYIQYNSEVLHSMLSIEPFTELG